MSAAILLAAAALAALGVGAAWLAYYGPGGRGRSRSDFPLDK